jgi:hypothetical protein
MRAVHTLTNIKLFPGSGAVAWRLEPKMSAPTVAPG